MLMGVELRFIFWNTRDRLGMRQDGLSTDDGKRITDFFYALGV